MKLSDMMICAVALLFGHGATAVAQTRLRPDNIDQVVREMTLEEKCHLVLTESSLQNHS